MKLKVIVKPSLTLIKENEIKSYGDIFEVSEERGKEILQGTYNGKPLVELVIHEDTKQNLEKKSYIQKENKIRKGKGDKNE